MTQYYLRSNTDLGMDVKTILHSSRITKIGKDYQGVLTRDQEDHYTFIETIPQNAGKRNPQVFNGKFITITRRDDGTYRPNFKPLKMGNDFSVEEYVNGVANELLWGMDGLIGKV